MSKFNEGHYGRVFIGRLEFGDDLLEKLTELCRSNAIKAGTVSAIGAVQNVKLGYYSQSEKKYTGCVEIDKKLEIASCAGNISLNDKNDIFVHLHIVLADHNAQTFGGHLMPGTKVFATEYCIEEITNIELKRSKDEVTGLPLWKNK